MEKEIRKILLEKIELLEIVGEIGQLIETR